MTYIATFAPWVGCFALGLLVGLYLRSGDARRIPEHPAIRRARERPRLHVVGEYREHLQPYDYEKETGG